MSRRQFLALIVPLLVVLLGFVVMTLLERTGAVGSPPWDDGFARYVRTTLAYEFVGGMDNERDAWDAYFDALNAYVRHFDGYAEVVPPWRVDQYRLDSSGHYVGIGVRPEYPDRPGPIQSARITGVKPGGPADKAGIKVGDSIIAVGGRLVAEIIPHGESQRLAAERLARLIRGPQGTKVRLRLRAPDLVERDVEVVRGAVDTGSIFGARLLDTEAGIGYVRIHRFQADTSKALRAELKALVKRGMRSLVLDLRRNLGGILPQAVKVADAFIDTGILVRVRGRGEEFTDTSHATRETTVGRDLPLAVLIDRFSASASEILAGALQDHRRALLIGERSYGKFLVQTVESVPMELGTALFKRTSAIYETPLGHAYPRRSSPGQRDSLAGLMPDLYVATSTQDREALGALFDHEYYADWNPAEEPIQTEFEDRVLEAAVAALKGQPYYPRLAVKE